MEPIRFIILCAARTGSTMLRHQLNSHPEICCHGEVMTAGAMESFGGLAGESDSPIVAKLLELRAHHRVRFMQDFVLFAGKKRAVGFKIKYEELALPEWRDVLGALREDRALKVIHLTRRNRLKRVLSKILATRVHGVFNVLTNADLPAPRQVRLTAEECLADFKEVAQREREFSELFGSHEIIAAVYENVTDPSTGELDRIQQFLGVTPRPLAAQTRKINSERLSDLIENYEELRRELAPHASFFE